MTSTFISSFYYKMLHPPESHDLVKKKKDCYTSQLKYVFRLEENVSRAIGKNSLTP